MSTDDLRVKVIEAISTRGIDRAIAIVWNEVIEAANDAVSELDPSVDSKGKIYVPMQDVFDAIRALRKLEEGG